MDRKRILGTVFLAFIVLAPSNMGVSQLNEIRIKFIGNCGLYMTDGLLDLYIDFPYKSGFMNYMTYNEAEIESIKPNAMFLFTHKHPDHYSIKKMREVLRKKKGKKFGKWNLKKLQKFCESTADFNVQAIQTDHSLSIKHFSYIITWHGKKFYISGDEESTAKILSVVDLDWAFVPYWLLNRVIEQKAQIDAQMVGVYHFFPGTTVNNSNPKQYKPLLEQGEIISVSY